VAIFCIFSTTKESCIY